MPSWRILFMNPFFMVLTQMSRDLSLVDWSSTRLTGTILNKIWCVDKAINTVCTQVITHHFRDPLFPFAVLRGLSFHNTS